MRSALRWLDASSIVSGLYSRKVNKGGRVEDASVARFNALAKSGVDADWHREATTLAALETPPYYAMGLTPAFVNTQGGPRRDENAQIVGANGAPIGRLYSAGELGSIYSFLYQGGGNIGECFAFGRIAGRNAAREVSRGVASTSLEEGNSRRQPVRDAALEKI